MIDPNDLQKVKRIWESLIYTIIAFIGVALAIHFFLASCTPQKRLNRLIKRHPYLLQEQQTIIVHDTLEIMIPGTKIDTGLSVIDLIDTATFSKDNLNVKAWIHNDTVYIDAECDTIYKTVIREIPVKTSKVIYRKPRDGLILLLLIIAVLIGLIAIVRSVYKYYFKR